MTQEEILRGIEAVAREHLDRLEQLEPGMDLVEDLELDSLLLLTLAVEVENRFRICLDQEDEASIRTVGDLMGVVHRKITEKRTRIASRDMKTLNEALDRAAGFADCGLRILDRRERQTWLDWAEIRRRSTIVAGGLRAQGIGRGEIVGLFYLTGEEFFAAFFGVLMAGAVPAPLYPPVRLGRLAEYQVHTSRMLQAAGVRNALIDGRLRRVLGLALSQAGCRGYTQAELPKRSEVAATVAPDELGLVQFSSGTTRDPKPVALTHQALMAQTRTLNGFWPDTEQRRHSGVSWLPLYHDMGLIGCVFTVLERPSTLTLIPPELFVARPVVWLRALSKFRATVSPAPNFAFSLCVEKVRDADLQDLDLSEWRAALCGAEAVVPAVLRRFADRFAGCGFRPEALTPVYGLSEAALAVTISDLGEPFTTRSMSRQQSGNAPSHERELVSVGRPLARVRDPGERRARRDVGRRGRGSHLDSRALPDEGVSASTTSDRSGAQRRLARHGRPRVSVRRRALCVGPRQGCVDRAGCQPRTRRDRSHGDRAGVGAHGLRCGRGISPRRRR